MSFKKMFGVRVNLLHSLNEVNSLQEGTENNLDDM